MKLGTEVENAIEKKRISYDQAFWFLEMGLCDRADTIADPKSREIAQKLHLSVSKHATHQNVWNEDIENIDAYELNVKEVWSELLERLW